MSKKVLMRIVNAIVKNQSNKSININKFLKSLMSNDLNNILDANDGLKKIIKKDEKNNNKLTKKALELSYKLSALKTLKLFKKKKMSIDIFQDEFIDSKIFQAQKTLKDIDTKVLSEASKISRKIISTKILNNNNITKKELEKIIIEELYKDKFISIESKKNPKMKFLNINNKNYKIESYSKMIVRTTVNELNNKAVIDVCKNNGHDLVRVSDNGDRHEPCGLYAGKIFSISGISYKYPQLVEFPPFHPNCVHYLEPFFD